MKNKKINEIEEFIRLETRYSNTAEVRVEHSRSRQASCVVFCLLITRDPEKQIKGSYKKLIREVNLHSIYKVTKSKSIFPPLLIP